MSDFLSFYASPRLALEIRRLPSTLRITANGDLLTVCLLKAIQKEGHDQAVYVPTSIQVCALDSDQSPSGL